MKNTINRYLGYYFFSNLVFQRSIFMIFLAAQRGVTVEQISVLEVALLLGVFCIEIPAGFFGDKFGRKLSVCIGLVILALSSIGFIIFSSFSIFVSLFALEGAGMAFISGSDESLLYENLKERQEEKDFLPTISKAMTLSYIALAISSLIGGLLQQYSWNLVYGLTSLMMVIAILFIIGIHDNLSQIDREKVNIGRTISTFAKEKDGQTVIKIFLIMGLFEGTALSFIIFSQQFFHMINTPTLVISILMTLGRFLSGGAIFITPKINEYISTKKLIRILMAVTSVIFMLNVFNINGLYFFTYFILTSLPYMANVLNVNFIHSLLPSEVRASAMSIGNAISSIFLGLCYLIIGLSLGSYDLHITVLTLALVNLLSVILYFMMSRKLSMEEGSGAAT